MIGYINEVGQGEEGGLGVAVFAMAEDLSFGYLR
jgi:hypothetical protein